MGALADARDAAGLGDPSPDLLAEVGRILGTVDAATASGAVAGFPGAAPSTTTSSLSASRSSAPCGGDGEPTPPAPADQGAAA